MNSLSRSPLAQYRRVDAHGSVENANPHRLVALLYDGLAESLAAARGAIERGDTAVKAGQIRKAAGILDALRSSLNVDDGGDMAANLDGLYEFMGRQITQANLRDDAGAIESAIGVNETLREAWAEIPEEARRGAMAA